MDENLHYHKSTKSTRRSNPLRQAFISLLVVATVATGVVAGKQYLENNSTPAQAASAQSLVSFGSNANGMLGNGSDSNVYDFTNVSNVSGIIQVSAGYQHSLGLKSDGTVYAWGSNGYSQLGQVTSAPISTAIQVPGLTGVTKVVAVHNASYAIKSDGTLWQWGIDSSSIVTTAPTQIAGISNVRDFNSTYFSNFATTTTGQLYVWGYNVFGQLGMGNQLAYPAPTLNPNITGVAEIYTENTLNPGLSGILARKTDSTLWAWGDQTPFFVNCAPSEIYSQVGIGLQCTIPHPVKDTSDPSGFLTNVRSAAIGFLEYRYYAVKNDGSVRRWTVGSASADAIEPAFVGQNVIKVASRTYGAVAYTASGNAYTWGSNDRGQLGLGSNSAINITSPTLVPSTGTVSDISSSTYNTILALSNGSVKAAGDNGNRQVGSNVSSTNSLVPGAVGSISLPPTSIQQVTVGTNHTAILKTDGTVWTWGRNDFGQLGNGSSAIRSTIPVQVSGLSGVTRLDTNKYGSSTMALKSDGTAWVWGDNGQGQLGNGTYTNSNVPIQYGSFTNVVDFAMSNNTSGIVLSDGTVRVSGNNTFYRLGIGTASPASINVPATPAITNVKNISMGAYGSNYIKNDNTVYMSGLFSFPNLASTPTLVDNGQTSIPNQPVTLVGCTNDCTYRDNLGNVWVIDGEQGLPLDRIRMVFDGNTFPNVATDVLYPYSTNQGVYRQIRADGSVYTSGYNEFGQIGNGSLVNAGFTQAFNLNNVTKIGGNRDTSFAVGYIISPLDTTNPTAVQNISFNCVAGNAEATTTCTFVLPPNTSLPNGFKLGVGNAVPGGSCSQDSQNYATTITITCSGVPLGTSVGTQAISAQVGVGAVTQTGETTTVNPRPFTVVGDTAFLGNLSGMICTPANPLSGDVTSCSGTVPSYIAMPTSLSLNVVGQASVSCTITGRYYTCYNLPVGVPIGIKAIQGVANGGAQTSTDVNVNVGARQFDPATDIPNLGTLAGMTCTSTSPTTQSFINCSGVIPTNVVPPNSLSLNLTGQAPVACVLNGQNFTCIGLPTGTNLGNIVIQGKAGSSLSINTNVSVNIVPRGFNSLGYNPFVSDTGYFVDNGTGFSTLTGLACTPTSQVSSGVVSCSGNLPTYILPPTSGSPLTIGVPGQARATCNFTGQAFVCPNIAVGNTVGVNNLQSDGPIQPGGLSGASTTTNIGTSITVTPRAYAHPSDSTSLTTLASVVCTPVNPVASSTVSCTGTLPAYITAPTGLSFNATGQTPAACTFAAQVFTCPSIAVGGTLGTNNIQANVGSGTAVNMGTSVNIGARPFDPATDLPNLNTLASVTCSPATAIAEGTVTCTGTIPTNITVPADLSLGLTGQTPTACTFAAQVFTCTNMPSGTTIGSIDLKGKVGTAAAVNVGKNITVNPRVFNSVTDIPTIGVLATTVCTPTNPVSDSKVTCSGTLPTYITPPTGLTLGVAGLAQLPCVFTAQAFTCVDIPVGSTLGSKNILGNSTGSATNIPTDLNINVVPRPLDGDLDLATLSTKASLTCTPSTVEAFSKTTCTGTLPANIIIPNNLSLSIDGNPGKVVTVVGQTFTATDLNVGAITGVRKVQAQLFSNPSQLAYVQGTKLDTGLTITVTAKAVKKDDVTNIGKNTDVDPFVSFTCNSGTAATTTAGTTTCKGVLKPGYKLPEDFKIGFTDTVTGCTIDGQNVTCTNVSLPKTPGDYNLKISIGGQISLATYKIKVNQPSVLAGLLPRTGGASAASLFTILSLITIAYVAPTIKRKIKVASRGR